MTCSSPAEREAPPDDFEWDEKESSLEVTQRRWFEDHRISAFKVVDAKRDPYGGCKIDLEKGFSLELYPCSSNRNEHLEHRRLLVGRAPEVSHFVVRGYGVGRKEKSPDD